MKKRREKVRESRGQKEGKKEAKKLTKKIKIRWDFKIESNKNVQNDSKFFFASHLLTFSIFEANKAQDGSTSSNLFSFKT